VLAHARLRGAAALLLLVLAGCASTPAPQSGLSRILADGTVRICSTGDYRPFTHRDTSAQWSGLDVDMAQDLAKRLGVKLELVQTTWGTLMADLSTKCDMAMGGISITLKRAEQATFTAPYLRDGKAAIVRCVDATKYRTLADIDRPGVRVVVNPGGTNADFDKANVHAATVVEYPDNNTIFDQLSTGAADVMITDASEIRWQTSQNPRLCAVSADRPFTFEQKAYLTPRGDADLQQWVAQWLNIAQHDGTFDALSRKYFGQVLGP
jgi:cyclohexadienyl dehydratase